MTLRSSILIAVGVVSISVSGCATNSFGKRDHTISQRSEQSAQTAREANDRGLAFAEKEQLDKAEQAFREALRHDMRYAAAHNNLGLILLGQGKLYEAAVEFRAASNLDSSAPEPVLNLARLYERIGWEGEGHVQHQRHSELLEMQKARSSLSLN